MTIKIRRRPPNPPVNVESLRYQVQMPESEAKNILEKIVWHKEEEIQKRRNRISLLELKKQIPDIAPPLNFLKTLKNSEIKPALIAEVKKSFSK